jgi:hypothetical protein
MGVLSIVCLFVYKICSFHNYRVCMILTSEASCLGLSKVNNGNAGICLAPDTRSRANSLTSLPPSSSFSQTMSNSFHRSLSDNAVQACQIKLTSNSRCCIVSKKDALDRLPR